MIHITRRGLAAESATPQPVAAGGHESVRLKEVKLIVLFVVLLRGPMQMATMTPDCGWQCTPRHELLDAKGRTWEALQLSTKASTQENLEKLSNS